MQLFFLLLGENDTRNYKPMACDVIFAGIIRSIAAVNIQQGSSEVNGHSEYCISEFNKSVLTNTKREQLFYYSIIMKSQTSFVLFAYSCFVQNSTLIFVVRLTYFFYAVLFLLSCRSMSCVFVFVFFLYYLQFFFMFTQIWVPNEMQNDIQ